MAAVVAVATRDGPVTTVKLSKHVYPTDLRTVFQIVPLNLLMDIVAIGNTPRREVFKHMPIQIALDFRDMEYLVDGVMLPIMPKSKNVANVFVHNFLASARYMLRASSRL